MATQKNSEIPADQLVDTMVFREAIKNMELPLQTIRTTITRSERGNYGVIVNFTESQRTGTPAVYLRAEKRLITEGILVQRGEAYIVGPTKLGISGGKFILGEVAAPAATNAE